MPETQQAKTKYYSHHAVTITWQLQWRLHHNHCSCPSIRLSHHFFLQEPLYNCRVTSSNCTDLPCSQLLGNVQSPPGARRSLQLTHCGPVKPYSIFELNQHWITQIMAWWLMKPNHWLIVSRWSYLASLIWDKQWMLSTLDQSMTWCH